MNTFLNKLLEYYGLSVFDYEKMNTPLEEIRLIDPNSILGMDKVKNRIFDAIDKKEKIIVYGDYDCDGISATSIMIKTFMYLDYPCSHYIPSRYLDGYGLNVNNVEKIAKAGFKLIITVDNGISQHDAINRANELGIDVIVVDHHEEPDVQVNAYAIIHPIVSKISDIYGSGGYMALFVSAALLGRFDDYLVTIAGLSVISDLMELKGYNRDVVKLALKNLEEKRYWPLWSLLENPAVITEKSFSHEIAPKINAVGRMIEDTKVNLLVKYLTSSNKDEVYKLHDWIIGVNESKKEILKTISNDFSINENEPGIVVEAKTKEGIIGIIANNLLGKYSKPIVIFVEDSKDPSILKGSARSKEGFSIVDAWKKLDKYIITGGGHAFAGGLSIKKEDFELFKRDFLEICKENVICQTNKNAINIEIPEITFENYNILRSLSPFGMGFEEPLFKISHLPTRALQFISLGKHLSTQLSIKTKLLGFNMSEMVIKSHPYIDIFGNFNISSFRDAKTLEFRISDYVASESFKK